MTTIEDADRELCRHRGAALAAYANRLLAAGADVEDERFRNCMLAYAAELERWRRNAMADIRQMIDAMSERRNGAALH